MEKKTLSTAHLSFNFNLNQHFAMSFLVIGQEFKADLLSLPFSAESGLLFVVLVSGSVAG